MKSDATYRPKSIHTMELINMPIKQKQNKTKNEGRNCKNKTKFNCCGDVLDKHRENFTFTKKQKFKKKINENTRGE